MKPTFLGDEGFVASKAGKKAGNLHVLLEAGFPVPKAFVVFDGDHFSDADLSRAIDDIGGYPVAVRSSGVLEDLAGASFAGQYETYLHVHGLDDLKARIEQCRDSAKAERVIAYLEKHNLDPKAARLAVLVQRMIEPAMAGVAFSVHPLSGREDHALIEACEGVGERLVSGQVAPSSFTIELRTGRIVEERLEDPIAKLTHELAQHFAKTLVEIQAHFGRPQDVEWAVDRNGALWILQARPITTMQWRTDLGDLSTSNMREGGIASRVCKPFVMSLIGTVMGESLHDYLASVHLLDRREPVTWMRLVYGRPYWSVGTLKRAMAKLPGFDEQHFDRGMGIEKNYGDAGPSKTRMNAETVLRALPTALAVKRWYRKNLAMLDDHRAKYEQRERGLLDRCDRFAKTDDAAFERDLRAAIHELFFWNERIYLVTGYTNNSAQREFNDTLAAIDRATGATTRSLRLMGGLSGIFHLDVNRALAKLAAVAREHGAEGIAWERALGGFLAQYGFHGDSELDVSVPRWCEVPERVRETVLAMVASDSRIADGDDATDAQRVAYEEERASVERRIDSMLSLRLRYGAQFRRRLERMRLFLRKKEELREFSTRSYLVVRRYVLEAGRRLVARGLLDHADDVFFLEVNELLNAWNSAPDALARLREDVRFRKQMHRGFRDFEPPEEIGAGVLAPAHSDAASASSDGLRGVGCSPGRAEGTARVIENLSDIGQLRDGDILVTRFTDPGWTPALGMVRGIVTEVGGVLSHAAVIGREYGIPAVLNVKGATIRIRSGQRVRVDGNAGTVEWIESDDASSAAIGSA